MTEMQEYTTRRPTGRPNWPFILIAGAEKAGKSIAWVEFSASPLVGRTLVVEVGETTSDMYGAWPGADYEMINHDGTHEGMLGALSWAARQPRVDGKPNALVFESGTVLWDLVADEQQAIANARAKAKAAKYSKPSPEGDATITMDQWNAAKDRWNALVNVLRLHDGPSIITARMEQVTLMDGNGKPTADKTWKVRAEKNLVFDVDAIVEIPRRREVYLTGVKSVVLQLEAGEHRHLQNFTIDGLLRQLGLDETADPAPRGYTKPRLGSYVASEVASIEGSARRQGGGYGGGGGQRQQQQQRPAGPDVQVVNNFVAKIRQLGEADVKGWRAAYDYAKTNGLMSAPIEGPGGERVQLGKFLMQSGTRAAQLAPQETATQPEASTPPAQPETAEQATERQPQASQPDSQVVWDFIGSLDVIQPNDREGWKAAYGEARKLGITRMEVPDDDGGRVELGRFLQGRWKYACTFNQTEHPDHAELAASGNPRNATAAESDTSGADQAGTVSAGTGGCHDLWS